MTGGNSSDLANTSVEAPLSYLDSFSTAAPLSPTSGTSPTLVRSQTLYVPAYPHIYYRDAQRSLNLPITPSLRNTSPETPIVLSTVDDHDSSGARVWGYLGTLRTLAPFASTYAVEEDLWGRVGPTFSCVGVWTRRCSLQSWRPS